MYGWIIKSSIINNDGNAGVILGVDGCVYTFLPNEQMAEFACPAPKTAVSFDTENGAAVINGIECENRDPEICRLDAKMRELVSEKRYMHCFRVSKIAAVLAEKCGYPAIKAEITGLIHDIAKENPPEENRRIIVESGMTISSFELQNHSILHAAAGSVLAASILGITDKDILDAIRYHNGRPAMRTLEEIIYIADHIDYLYKNGLDYGNIAEEPDLDSAAYKVLNTVNVELVKHGQTTDPITESTMNYLLMKLDGSVDSGNTEDDDNSPVSDELFDIALDIQRSRSLPLKSVSNIRELGSIKAADGKSVRHGALVRSASLNGLTKDEADQLAEFGIDTVIDLRSFDEIRKDPDINTEHFTVLMYPLPELELNEYQKNVLEKFKISDPGSEKAYYLIEYLSSISMKDMYIRILTDPESVSSLHKIFEILADPAHRGYLIHCAGGKDRTGIVCALLLIILGADITDVRNDYYASVLASFSETEAYAQSLRKHNYASVFVDEIRYYNSVGINIIEMVWKELIEEFGTIDNYISDVLKLSNADIARLREKFTS